MKVKNLLESDHAVRIVSFVIAVMAWVIVVVGINPEAKSEVRNLPVQVKLSDTSIEKLGLELISDQVLTANVTVTGARTVVGTLNDQDIEIVAVPSGITEPGTYSGIQLQARNISNGKQFEIDQCTPSTVTLKFDRKTAKSFPVTMRMNDFSVSDGYLLEEVITSPASITVSGPENDIAAISECAVFGKIGDSLKSTTIMNVPIVLLDADGQEIKNNHLTLSVNSVDITIPVLKKKTLPVSFSYLNMPDGFDPRTLSYVISNASIEVAGPESVVDQWSKIDVGYVDLSELDDTREYEFDVVLPTTFVNVENVSTVMMRFDLSEYEVRTFTVKDIRLENQPSEYTVNVNTQNISKVRIIGPKSTMETLTAEQLYAVLDMDDVETITGQYKIPVRISADGHKDVWAVGEYSIVINVETK